MATTKTAQRSSGSDKSTSGEEKPTGGAEREQTGGRTATVNLPFVTAEFRAPEIHMPSLPDRAEITEAVSSRLPTPTQAVYYSGLVALGFLELIEWPIVLALGVGTAIAQQACAQQRPEPGERRERTETATG